MKASLLSALLVALVLAVGAGCRAAPAAATPAAAPAWGYTGSVGPAHWADLSPDWVLARAGRRQSPIDIATASAAPDEQPAVTGSYAAMPLVILDNGHTVELKAAPGSFLQAGEQRYELQQFHFHSPSEHTLDGRRAALEVHLVHADDQGGLAVVSVLVAEGAANPFLAAIWPHLPGGTSGPVTVAGASIDLDDLLPASLASYAYSGSLTTPPCSEDVSWFVLQQPVEASPEQVRSFRAVIDGNNRPTQPLNGRRVRARG